MAKIFICYRRADTEHVAGRIYDRLANEFGKDNVFKDVDDIPIGVNFRRHLEEAISKCDIMLVLIGDKWLAFTRRRQEDERDFVRIEIELALKQQSIIVPIIVDEKPMPMKKDLPSSIQELADYSGMTVRGDPYFHSNMEKLIGGLASILPGEYQRGSRPLPQGEDNKVRRSEQSHTSATQSPVHPPSLKGSNTEQNLKDAFAGESVANRRYLYFAIRADVEGYNDTAAVFRSTAESETSHAFGHLDYLEEVGDPLTGMPIGATVDNLKAAIAGETYEYTEMYPGMAKQARQEGFLEIADWLETLAKAERSHANRFQKALDTIEV
jgi:rubrerythrin